MGYVLAFIVGCFCGSVIGALAVGITIARRFHLGG